MTPEQYITKKVREVCPETMDLKFGCILSHPDYGSQLINDERRTGNGDVMKYFTDGGNCFYSECRKGNKIRKNSMNEEWWDIIGTPVTLSEILRTIKHFEMISANPILSISTSGLFAWLFATGDFETIRIKWDLTQNLDEQSNETKLFIAKILGYEG